LIVSDPTSPLDILLTVMRDRFLSKDYDSAVAIAKAVAPFVHAKPRARGEAGGSIESLRDNQLVELCRSRVARAGVTQEDSAESGSVVPFRAGRPGICAGRTPVDGDQGA